MRISFVKTLISICKKRFCLLASAFLYITVVSLLIYVFFLAAAPKNFPEGEFILSIEPGTSIKQAAKLLEDKSLIKSAILFELWTGFKYGHIKAGDYLFKSPETVWSLSRRLATGAHGLTPVKILIKEGATRREMANIFASKLYRFNPDRFLLITADKEGFLFPDTYTFLPNATEEDVANTMLSNFNKKIKPYAKDIEKSKMSLNEIVNLASLVEREAHNKKDRKMIAGVLLNRLRIGMPLQVDVTWFYTHNKGTPGITLKDLRDRDNPYNTYIHKGLPPSPIGSPGISSIEAVLYPIKNDYLFYLADKNGVTYYSSTYQEHLQKRNKYIKQQ